MPELRHALRPQTVTDQPDLLVVRADVLVVGGGPAATWAAIAAAESGARVALVDKGYCGTSGVAATAGVGHWLVPPDPQRRDEEISVRERQGGYLMDRVWTEAVLDETWERTKLIPEWGYRTPPSATRAPLLVGRPGERSFAGSSPGYLRFLRGKVKKSGVLVLDHSPAIELLTTADGHVSGAAGRQRQVGRPWRIHAGAVVLATGGTTWKSHSLGGDVDTGDGHLMAAEVGAHLSSMEFSNFYGMVPLGTSMDKNGFFVQASYWDHTGAPLPYRNLHESRAELLAASLQGTITAQFTQFPPEAHARVRAAMPNFFMVADKLGIDPFTTPFPMDWVQEGTVRGTGGVRILDRDAWTGVAGLYAAGDVTARDRLVGSATGAGGPNLAWAIATGTWAGRAAATHAGGRLPVAPADVRGTGTIGVRPRATTTTPDEAEAWRSALALIQSHMLPIDRSVFRHEDGLVASIAELDDLWHDERALVPLDGPHGAHALRTREVAGMLATARWATRSALARTETRGMHTRTDHPATDPGQAHRLLVGGLDDPWVRRDPELPVTGAAAVTVPAERREAS